MKIVSALNIPEQTAPATPAANTVVIYAKADGRLYYKDDTGLEIGPITVSAGGSASWASTAKFGVD